MNDEGLARLNDLTATWSKAIEARTGGREQDADMIARAFESDLFFHMTLMEIAANHKAMQVFHDCHLLTRVFGSQPLAATVESLEMERQDLADHQQILQALRDGEGRAAARVMDCHLRRGKRQLLDSMKKPTHAQTNSPQPWSRAIWAAIKRAENHRFGK